jgi:hypothetical protein
MHDPATAHRRRTPRPIERFTSEFAYLEVRTYPAGPRETGGGP